jgi:predicted metal-binding protein
MGAEVTLLVCTTCRAGEPVEDGRPVRGARLHAALAAEGAPAGVRIVAVECLSACSNGASVALAAPGRWAYVYGHMAEADAPAILAGAARYAAAPDGLVPWRERPEIFRKRSLARLPPLSLPDPQASTPAATLAASRTETAR